MNKKVLILFYSQSGQLKTIVDYFKQPFLDKGISLEIAEIKPVNNFDFPWKDSAHFFDTMPESVLAETIPLQPFSFQSSTYDLVVFAYQPWYLTLSIPANSAIHHPDVQKILKNTPVVTLIGARNMWLNAQENLKAILKNAGATLVGNIALVDRHQNQVSAVTILYWMLTGKKDSFLGIFPKPGISDEDIAKSKLFGEIVADSLWHENLETLQNQLLAQNAVAIEPDYIIIETRAPKLFLVWAGFIKRLKNRSIGLLLFKYYLLFALFIVAPIVLTVNAVFFRPFLKNKIRKQIAYYSNVN